MFPILFKIGPLTIHTYGVLVATGFIIGIALALHLGKKEGIAREKILDIGFYSVISAIVGSRIFFVLTQFEYFIDNPLDILKVWEGGLVFYGGLLLVIPVILVYIKKNGLPMGKTLDLLSPCLALGHAIGRIGCFSAGSCYGRPTDMPWGVTFNNPDSQAIPGIPLHPTQLYESFSELVIFVFLMVFKKHKSFDGQVTWIYLLLYSTVRFTIEFFRGDRIRGFIYGDFSISQGISLMLFLTATAFLLSHHRRKNS